jgi:UDP-2,3-diacylglucosamine hydrolase
VSQAPVVDVSGSARALFASDIHLGEHDPATARMFDEALAQHAAGASHLFLLGDLFEAWVGDDGADAESARLVDRLAALARSGVRVFAMRGNRDFLLDVAPASPPPGWASFCARTGATMLEDPSVVSLFGRRALLMHGDSLCADDVEYQRFRALTRAPAWQQAFLARSLEERIAVALDLRARSELSKAEKADAIMDANAGAVLQALREAGVDLMVHGHTHRPARHLLEMDGAIAQRWVLPDWNAVEPRGGMLEATAEGLRRIGPWAKADS